MKNYLIKISLLLLILTGMTKAQSIQVTNSKRPEVTIQSWKKGTDVIKSELIRVLLSSKNKRYRHEFVSDSGKRYLLKIIHSPYFNLNLEHWEVKMFEVLSNNGKPKLSESLFSPEKYGTYGQVSSIGVLYPEEEPIVFSEKEEPLWGEGTGFYYFKTARKINIENFCVVIKVGNYKFNKRNKSKLDLFEVFIEIRSLCKTGN